ncbi:MAG: hypothetical protein HOP12_11780 [Candidatus Eisenbacteria bacterium]|uniref:Uncharacterized protein n=1 Tax=Eiseniibacteriota bacterium TaxID=2212470 RepID=A0A849SM36_UNCEI|nr:hypothetical protein [Candidatus Eisenbacteria bacterium]
MSGEATRREATARESLERAFGESAHCSACAAAVADYRVVALFLHEGVVVRAYCRACYDDALAGEYGARGEGLLLDYDAFVERFGAAGPRPRVSPVDRALFGLMRDSNLASLTPATECLARRRGTAPYRFAATFGAPGHETRATFELTAEGRMQQLTGDASAQERVQRAVEG